MSGFTATRIAVEKPAHAVPATTAGRDSAIRLLVTIDTECDKGPHWRVQRPLRFANVIEGVPRRLQPIFDAHGIKPTYLLSPEVIADDECAALFRSLSGKVDLGTHLHPEFIAPEPATDAIRTDAAQCDLAPEIEFAKLANLTRLFEERIGFRPTCFRAGRFGIGPHTLGFLEQLGYRVDSSVTPNRWWFIERGRGVNFLGTPVQPYHPSVNDFRRPGEMRILEVPVTVLHPIWDQLPSGLLRALRPFSRWQTVLYNLLGGNDRRCRWLRPTYSTAKEMIAVTTSMILRDHAKPTVLCMMFHSNEATVGASPYSATDSEVLQFLRTLDLYLSLATKAFSLSSCGLSDAPNPN